MLHLATVEAVDALAAKSGQAPVEWPWLYPALAAARLLVVNDRPTAH